MLHLRSERDPHALEALRFAEPIREKWSRWSRLRSFRSRRIVELEGISGMALRWHIAVLRTESSAEGVQKSLRMVWSLSLMRRAAESSPLRPPGPRVWGSST